MTESSKREHPAAQLRRLIQAVIVDPGVAARLSAVELDLLLRGLRRVKLLAWLGVRLQQAGILESMPEAAIEQLASAIVLTDARARLARWELNRIEWALQECEDLRVVALKGCGYLLRDLPNAHGRLFADVDLMVAEADLDVVEQALSVRGWGATKLSPYDQNFYRAWSHELPAMVHEEREVEVDVHHNILGRFARIKPNSASLMADVQSIRGSHFLSLSDADVVLHAMTHMMCGGDQADGLRDLVDIDILSRHFADADENFWEKLSDRAEQLGLQRPAYYSLRYAVRLLGTPVPDRVLAVLAGSAPNGSILALMDALVPLALFPQHPDVSSVRVSLARWLLYVRSHWVSMPPLMLIRHLAYKFYANNLEWRIRS